MEEETIETNDSLNVDQETVEVETDNTPTLEDYENLLSEKKKLEETNKKLYARIKQVRPPELKKTELISSDRQWQEKLELKVEGYSEAEIAFIQRNGGRKALEDTYVKTALDAMRQQSKAEQAVEIDSTPKSDIEKKYTEQQMREMPLEELEKLVR